MAIREQVVYAEVVVQIHTKAGAVEPWPLDAAACRQRNGIDRLVHKLKQFRAVATRYDKLKENFLATIQVVLAFIKLRSIVNTT